MNAPIRADLATAEAMVRFVRAHKLAMTTRNPERRRGRPAKALVYGWAVIFARKANVPAEAILSMRRQRYLVWPRMLLIGKLRNLYGYSLPGIGLSLDMHHTTVMHAVRRLPIVTTRMAAQALYIHADRRVGHENQMLHSLRPRDGIIGVRA